MSEQRNKAYNYAPTAEEEMLSLKNEIENFQKEKDRVRGIIGQIGGVPAQHAVIFNVIFVVFVLACLIISLLSGGILRLAMIELAIAAISMKLIYLIHIQSRVNHFQLWILTTIEWQVNGLQRSFKKLNIKLDPIKASDDKKNNT